MTTAELADYLSVKVSRVHDCWRSWGLPAIRIGNSLRFRRTDVEQWIAGQDATA